MLMRIYACYTPQDARNIHLRMTAANWKLAPSPTSPVADIGFYEVKAGVERELAEQFDGTIPLIYYKLP